MHCPNSFFQNKHTFHNKTNEQSERAWNKYIVFPRDWNRQRKCSNRYGMFWINKLRHVVKEQQHDVFQRIKSAGTSLLQRYSNVVWPGYAPWEVFCWQWKYDADVRILWLIYTFIIFKCVFVLKQYLDSATMEGPKVCICFDSATLHWLMYGSILKS